MIIKTGLKPKMTGPTAVQIIQSQMQFGNGYILIPAPNPEGELWTIEFGDTTVFSKNQPKIKHKGINNRFPSEALMGDRGRFLIDSWLNESGAPDDMQISWVYIEIMNATDYQIQWWEIEL